MVERGCGITTFDYLPHVYPPAYIKSVPIFGAIPNTEFLHNLQMSGAPILQMRKVRLRKANDVSMLNMSQEFLFISPVLPSLCHDLSMVKTSQYTDYANFQQSICF